MTTNKQEIKYILYSVGFALVWFMYILPYLVSLFDGQDAFMQFILFNLGLILFFQILLRAFTLNSKIKIIESIGLTLLFIGIDTIQPPYAVLSSGQLISTGPLLMLSSSDYIIALIGQNMGIHGQFLYYFTYIVAPAILFYLSSRLLPNFVKNL